MRNFINILILAASLALTACKSSTQTGASLAVPEGTIYFKGASVQEVLALYRDASHRQLIVASDVKTLEIPIYLHVRAVSSEDAIKLLEKALAEQAGVIITKLDDKRFSVTFNDSLFQTNTMPKPTTNQNSSAK